MKNFSEYRSEEAPLAESTAAGRYSVEVNYRTQVEEVLDEFAKICLGFVSAAMKNLGFHVKHVYEERPFRILVSSRNWDDGEWVGVVSWHAGKRTFVLSKGFFNRDRKTVSVQASHPARGTDASEIVGELRSLMQGVKGKPDRHQEKLAPVPLKRGPKK